MNSSLLTLLFCALLALVYSAPVGETLNADDQYARELEDSQLDGSQDDIGQLDKRAQTFVRFGKRAQTFVRFGKRAQTFVRFG